MMRRASQAFPVRRASRLRFETLEDRLQPSGIVPFAQFDGTFGADGRAAVPIHVLSEDFQAPAKGLLLAVQSEPGTRVDGALQTLSSRANGRSVLKVASGENIILARGPAGSSYTLDVGLAGDANGDFLVNAQDVAIIRSDIRSRSGSGTAADVNGDGRVNRADLTLAMRNLGASTTVRPLSLSEQLAGKTAVNAAGQLINSKIEVVGQTLPGQQVSLSQTSFGTTLTQQTTAAADGSYQFDVGLGGGTTLLTADATDGFGQHAEASLSVTRPGPDAPLDTDHNATAILVNNFGSTITKVIFTHQVGLGVITSQTVKAASLAQGATLSLPVEFKTGTGALADKWYVQFTDSKNNVWQPQLGLDRLNLEDSDAGTTFNVTIGPPFMQGGQLIGSWDVDPPSGGKTFELVYSHF